MQSPVLVKKQLGITVSMKSGLEDRNNIMRRAALDSNVYVSMKSGLEDRNNQAAARQGLAEALVSMKSGLEDRNNPLQPPVSQVTENLSQ